MSGDPLAAAVVALAADPAARARLRALLATERTNRSLADPPAYTVDSLATMLKVTAKVIRNAIARGELYAVKRGGRWIIPADAVRAWAAPPAQARARQLSPAKEPGPLTAALARLNGGPLGSTMAEP